MEAYLNHYERPPPNRLVTRQLESEKSYDEAAWSDDYWEETLAKRKEIADVLDTNKKPMLSPKPPANGHHSMQLHHNFSQTPAGE